ncbi:MAG: substrate-binding domain-containing protein, partial [Acidimicrobiia bacterium]
MTKQSWFKKLALLAVVAMLAVACGGDDSGSDTTAAGSDTTAAGSDTTAAGSDTTAAGGEGGTFVIGYSNGGGVGNGFREEQVCTAKAEALSSGQVSELITIHRNTDAAGQLSDIRDLIAADVDAIVFNPNDTDALNPALEEAQAAGIITVSVDAAVSDPNTYNLYN